MRMDEISKPSDELYDRDNAVEIKAGNFLWELAPDTSANAQTAKKKERGERLCVFCVDFEFLWRKLMWCHLKC